MENPFGKFFGRKVNKKKKHEPGTFVGDTCSSTLTREQRERFGLDETLIEFDQQNLEKVFPSKDLQLAFRNLKALTFPKVHALNQKRLIAYETKERNLILESDLSIGTAVYIGSAADIEYPLLLGAREITMVDPFFSTTKGAESLIQEIKSIIGDIKITIEKNDITFPFCFKEGSQENIKVHLEGKRAKIGVINLGDDIYVPNKNISLLIGFASGGYLDEDKNLIDAVIKDGYILSDLKSSDEEMFNKGFIKKVIKSGTLFKKEGSPTHL